MMKRLRLWGRLSPIGLAFAVLIFAFDQAHKVFMLHSFRIAERQPVEVMPFFDLVLVWNRGVSYGWFAQHTAFGRFGLVALSLVASLALWIWLARTERPWDGKVAITERRDTQGAAPGAMPASAPRAAASSASAADRRAIAGR